MLCLLKYWRRPAEDALNFCAMTGVRPMIETFPLDKVSEALDRMMSNTVRFRAVLVQWSPHRQEPVAPLKNATSRACAVAPAWRAFGHARVSDAFIPRREPGDFKARD